MKYAKDYKCKKCGKKQATAFFGLADPDAEQTPMCEDCILEMNMDIFHEINIIKRRSKK